MDVADGARHHLRYFEGLLQENGGEDARLDVRADGDGGGVEVADAHFLQELHGGGVARDGIGHLPHHHLGERLVAVNGKHVVTDAVQFMCQAYTEPAHADDGYLVSHSVPLNRF